MQDVEDPHEVDPLSTDRNDEQREGERPDLAFLKDREIFTQVPAFSDEPVEGTIEDLLHRGFMRHAANKTIDQIVDSDDWTVFEAWSLRLALLLLLGYASMAANEALTLGDLSSDFYIVKGQNIVPWKLRVLAIRIQAKAFKDHHRAILLYYSHAIEARKMLRDGHDEYAAYLGELEILVVMSLLELNDFELAILQLERIPGDRAKRLTGMIYLQSGSVDEAEKVLSEYSEYSGLLLMSRGQFEEAVGFWETQMKSKTKGQRGYEETCSNLAICQVYTGHLEKAIMTLEKTIPDSSIDQQIFNLATLYELKGDSSSDSKRQLLKSVGKKVNTLECYKLPTT